MSVSAKEPPKPTAPRRMSDAAGWTLVEYESVGSTNLVAATLPAWNAVLADTQSAGRGRFQRSWVSDAGGLWLSAVVPLGGDPIQNRTIPLVAGLSIIEALQKLGVVGARLRWPNDVMVGGRKLAGLLVDRFSPQLAVVGMGMNVTNRPADHDSSLARTATRLADLQDRPFELRALATLLLASLRSELEQFQSLGFAALTPRINRLWGESRRVRLQLDAGEIEGEFTGVDGAGRLLLAGEHGIKSAFDPHEVRLLREI